MYVLISISSLFQDTIVALQALAKYAERPEFNNIDLRCTVTSDKTKGHLLSYHIENSNANVQEEVDVSINLVLIDIWIIWIGERIYK